MYVPTHVQGLGQGGEWGEEEGSSLPSSIHFTAVFSVKPSLSDMNVINTLYMNVE